MEAIGRFKIVDKIGRGAFGMVYKGHDPVINRYAAIKVMSEATAGDAELVARFRREAEAAGQLNHRNIVTIYDLGEHKGLPYIAMEFLEGRDLERIIKERQDLPVDAKVSIIIQVAEGLHHAHTKGIVHRDIKPGNIRLLEDGTVKIMDFGIAKMASSDMTRTGQFMGTVNYMAPEQIKAKKLDGRCDMFAVGAMFYELLTYRRPFPGDSITAVIYKIVNEKPAPIKELAQTPYAWLEGVVLKCLEKDANNRFESCQALADALRARQKVAMPLDDLDATVSSLEGLLKTGNHRAVIEQSEELLRSHPDNPKLAQVRRIAERLGAAESLIEDGRLEQARAELAKALSLDPDNQAVKDRVAALEERVCRQRAEAMVTEGLQYLKDGRFEPGIQIIEEATRLDPYNEQAKQLLARARDQKTRAETLERLAAARQELERGQLDAARAILEETLRVDPYSREAKALAQRVEAELSKQRGHQTIEDALLRARTALRTESFEAAQAAVEAGLKADSTHPQLRELVQQIKQERARADERKAVLNFIAAGDRYLKTARFDEARLEYQKALKLDPQAIGAKQGLEAASRRRTFKRAEPEKTGGAGKWVAVFAGLAILGLAAAAAYFLLPSPASKAVAAGHEAQSQGDWASAAASYFEATQARGSSEELEAARKLYAETALPLVRAGELDAAKEVADKAAAWDNGASLPAYKALAQGFAERDQLGKAHQAYKAYFEKGGYASNQYAEMVDYFELGNRLGERDTSELPLDERLAQCGFLASASRKSWEMNPTQKQFPLS